MADLNVSPRHSLLIRIAAAMIFVTLVVLVGMGSALIVAETTRGNAGAINTAGSLRMQSHRLSALVLAARVQPDNAAHRQEIAAAIQTFEQTLQSKVLADSVIASPNGASAAAWRTVAIRWEQQVKPMLGNASHPAAPGEIKEGASALLAQTDSFVSDINTLVALFEKDAETRIGFLYSLIVLTLVVTLSVVLMMMLFLSRSVLMPLRVLGRFTDEIRRGNLDARTPYAGEDELGQLGNAFNLMAADLAVLYRSMETRVAEKTADLERSNRSLELLYHSIARLYAGPVDADTFRLLLREIEEVLGLGAGSVCLMDGATPGSISVLASTLNPALGEVAFCSQTACAECMEGEGLHEREVGERNILSIPLRDAERVHGVMQLLIPSGQEVAPWKMRLLEALARHIGTAIGTARRTEHERMLSLLEERSVIARELHDSLAQSLAYMKIQVSRLANVISREGLPDEAGAILGELREGLNGAYRQLRELLTTFRLRIEGESLSTVLESTTQEFSSRNPIRISLEVDLTNCLLTANEEIHILQIVREALSNVVHHAHAQHARVVLNAEADGRVSVLVEDDGVGFKNQQAQTHHYGMAIMEERAHGLGGRFETMARPEGGARVLVRFMPQKRGGAVYHRQA